MSIFLKALLGVSTTVTLGGLAFVGYEFKDSLSGRTKNKLHTSIPEKDKKEAFSLEYVLKADKQVECEVLQREGESLEKGCDKLLLLKEIYEDNSQKEGWWIVGKKKFIEELLSSWETSREGNIKNKWIEKEKISFLSSLEEKCQVSSLEVGKDYLSVTCLETTKNN